MRHRNCMGLALALIVFSFWVSGFAQEENKVLEIDDPLTNGTTLGMQKGGVFTSGGWKTQGPFDYIQYNIPTCSWGEVEFDIQGIYASNEVFPNISYDKSGKVVPGEEDVHYSFFCMYDRDDNHEWFGVNQWHNPYKCIMHIYGYVPGDIWKWGRMKLRLNVAAYESGYDDDPHAFEDPIIGPFDWQKDHVYHHRLVWGNGHMRWYMDGELIKDWDYSSFGVEYAPPDHSIRIGSGWKTIGSAGFKSPTGITISNFKFYRYQDLTPPTVIGAEPQMVSGGVSLDADIFVHFSEPMDAATTAKAFSIRPVVNGQVEWVGNALYFHRSELLQPNTTYTIRVTTLAQDRAGHSLTSDFEYQFTTSGVTPDRVGKYETFEVPLIAQGLGNVNRYTDVTVKGVFTGPTHTIEIEGFWDGGDLWKVRMVPDEVGHWEYQITSSVPSLQASGSFECIPSTAKGFVRVNPHNPYTFMYDDGTPWLWKGDTSWRGFTHLVPYEGRWKPYIDLRASQGYTAVQSIVVSYIGGMNFWKNEGGLCFAEYGDHKDYNQLNPDYFRWIDKRIDYANQKGIVSVMLFTWAQEFVKFSEEQFQRFERYLIARYAAKNVIWVISGEYNEVTADFGIPTSVFADHGRLIKQYDPYDHPITLHPTGRSSSAEFVHQDWFDFIMQQTPYFIRDVQRDRQYNKPVVNGEPRYFYMDEDNAESRYGLWEIATCGGFYTVGFIPTYAPDKGGWDMDALPQEQRWAKILNSTLEHTHWYSMQPHQELIDNGQLIADPGREYLAYSRSGGPTTIDLSGISGSLSVEWINPRSGTREKQSPVSNPGTITFSPPFEGDWVLHIGEGVKRDSIPPNSPLALTSQQQTMHSITISWQAPLAAEDGDVAAAYVIYRNGRMLTTTAQTSFVDQGLNENTTYEYEVYTVDDEGNQSESAAQLQVSTLRDDKPPAPLSVQLIDENTIVINFDEQLDETSAENTANFTITPSVTVLSATLSADGQKITLSTSAHQAGESYTITIRNIMDRATSPNVMSMAVSFTYHLEDRLLITQLTPSSYRLDTLTVNDTYYLDRDFTLLRVPDICAGFSWILTENDDKNETDPHWLSFRTNLSTTVLIAYDRSVASIPSWLQSWQDTGESIMTTDDAPLQLYRKDFPAGEIVLGANEGGQSSSMYIVLVKALRADVTDTTPPAVPQGFRFGAL